MPPDMVDYGRDSFGLQCGGGVERSNAAFYDLRFLMSGSKRERERERPLCSLPRIVAATVRPKIMGRSTADNALWAMVLPMVLHHSSCRPTNKIN